jgi:2-iminoacetate synthase ThiH
VVRWGYNESEVLNSFRPGSQTIVRSVDEIEQKGLQVVPVLGAEPLPERLRQAHAEIRPGPGMTRAQFKQILKELE